MIKYNPIYTLFSMLVFCTSSGGQTKPDLSKDNIKSETKDTLTSNIWDIKQDRNGNIWFAASDGVFQYDGKSFTKITGQLISKPFFSVLEDRKGNFWFGTYGSGVYYYDGKSFQNFTMKGGNWWDNFITTFMEDKTGKLWIGTRADISIYDGKTFTPLTNKDGEAIVDVFSIIEDKEGNIWLGGWDGLRRYDGKTFTKFTHNKGYNFIIEDKKGNIWATGHRKGYTWALARYDQKPCTIKNPL